MPVCVARRVLPGLFSATVVSLIGTMPATRGGEHPSLLITAEDVPRLRHACGVGPSGNAQPAWGRFGRRAADYLILRGSLSGRADHGELPGELTAIAFLHLIDGTDPGDATRLQTINTVLQEPPALSADMCEAILALDWCWAALDPAARDEFLLNARKRAEPLTALDSPLEPRRFREKLASLALAVIADQDDCPSPSWVTVRERLIQAGRAYFTTTFTAYVERRSLSPTSPAAAAREECDTALALEVGSRLLGRDLWADCRPSVGRWLEHYVLCTLAHPALQHNFMRDDGTAAPLSPAPAWRDFMPVTAHLIAARTADPAAELIAGRIESILHGTSTGELSTYWRWVPIVFPIPDVPRCDVTRLPTARDLGSAVIFRGGTGPETTAIWIDAAQPFLRCGQHFDAGHFLICRGGELAVGAGDDVAVEAVPAKGGSQHLGHEHEPFDLEQFCTATIAHNCVVLWDATRIARWRKALYLPVGGQRCQDDTCTDFATPLDAQGRQTGRRLAYGWNEDAAYLALDLAPAYDRRYASAYTREFLFLWGNALVVIDRVTQPKGRSVPTWVVNIPARPQVDGSDLPDRTRVAGSTNDAGVWRCDDAAWLQWADRDGGLWFSALSPTQKCLRVAGGPARKLLIKEGQYAGRTYVGGDADSFERLIVPAERHGAQNAWYRLGQPTLLGPEFGKTPHWGRIEVEPLQRESTTTFVMVLITDSASAQQTPAAELKQAEDALVLRLRTTDDQATVRVPAATTGGGVVQVTGTKSFTWSLPTDMQPDKPLAGGTP